MSRKTVLTPAERSLFLEMKKRWITDLTPRRFRDLRLAVTPGSPDYNVGIVALMMEEPSLRRDMERLRALPRPEPLLEVFASRSTRIKKPNGSTTIH